MPQLSRLRLRLRRLARSPVAYWLAAGILAVVTGTTVAGAVGRAHAELARYGGARPTVVARRDVDVGDVLDAGDVVIRSEPAAFVPDGAAGSVDAVVGRTVVAPVFAGEPVLRVHLAPDGVRGLAALLPRGRVAVGVPVSASSARVRRGDTVDVLGTFDPAAAAGGEPTFAVATAALVVDVGQESATVAVTPEEAKRVAFAEAHGAVTLTVTSPIAPRR